MKLNTYTIRGYTGPNADFTFDVDAADYPTGITLRDLVRDHIKHECDWVTDLVDTDTDFAYELSMAQERSDLRDNDATQRVWVFTSGYCNQAEDLHLEYHDCTEDDCERDDYMITIDENEQED